MFCRSISNNDWTLIGILPRVLLESDNRELFSMLVTGCFLIAVFCAIIYMIISAYIVKPLRVISIALGRIEAGETSLRLEVPSGNELGELARRINSMLDQIGILHAASVDYQLKLQDALYQARQAQISPHFVINTLNSIRWMAHLAQAENVKRAIDSFGMIMRYASPQAGQTTCVRDEIDIAKKYVYLQQLAYTDKFVVKWDVKEHVLHAKCIRFLLQPLIENSILHGACPKSEEVEIYVSVYAEHNRLVFNVYDSGAGMSDNTIANLLAGGGGAGLKIVLERVRMMYGDQCLINISSELGHYTNVMICTPLEYIDEEKEA